MKSISVQMELSIILFGSLIILIVLVLLCNCVRNSIYNSSVEGMLSDSRTHINTVKIYYENIIDVKNLDELYDFSYKVFQL